MVRVRSQDNHQQPRVTSIPAVTRHEKIAIDEHAYYWSKACVNHDYYVCESRYKNGCRATLLRMNAPPFRVVQNGQHTCAPVKGNVEAQQLKVAF